jgi:phospholipid-binding lipoprotein MlaA
MKQLLKKTWHHSMLLAAALLLAACASDESRQRTESDPWEPLNRGIYKANDVVDRAIIKPVAIGYYKVMPKFARRGVSNFADNLKTPRSAVNNFLQGKPKRGLSDITRFLFNSTIGLIGLIDVASAGGLEVYDEDFGQTLAVWGVPDGPFVYLPLFGPQTLRDALALPVDILSNPVVHYNNTSVRDKLYVLLAIDARTRFFVAERFLKDSKDPYVTIRESYQQSRRFLIYDGDPPEDDDFFDDFEDDDFEDDDN